MKQKHIRQAALSVLPVAVVLGSGWLGVKTLHFSSADAVYAPPASIASDCSSDTTDAFNAWLSGVPDNATISFGANACYRLDQTLSITGKNNWVINGNGASFKRITPTPANLQNPNRNPHFSLQNDTSLSISNLHIIGLNTTSDIDPASGLGKEDFEPQKFGASYGNQPFESGMELFSDTNVTVDSVTTDGTYGDGFTVGGENQTVPASFITIKNSTVDRNGRQGVAIVNAHDVLLDNVKALHSHAAGLDIEPNGAKSHVSNVEVRNSYFNSRIVNISLGGAQGQSNINFHDNTLQAQDQSYPWFFGHGSENGPSQNIQIIHNHANYVAAHNAPIVLGNSNLSNVEVENNYSQVSGGFSGVSLNVNVTGSVKVVNNQFPGAAKITDAAVTGATICGNQTVLNGVFNQPAMCAASPPAPPSPTQTTSGSDSNSSSAPTSTSSGSVTGSSAPTAPTNSPDAPLKAPDGSPVTAVVQLSSATAQHPASVSGTIAVAPSGSGSVTSVEVDGKPVSGTAIDTTALSNGRHVISITQNGKTKQGVIIVHNSLQSRLASTVRSHKAATGAGLSTVILAVVFYVLFIHLHLRYWHGRWQLRRRATQAAKTTASLSVMPLEAPTDHSDSVTAVSSRLISHPYQIPMPGEIIRPTAGQPAPPTGRQTDN